MPKVKLSLKFEEKLISSMTINDIAINKAQIQRAIEQSFNISDVQHEILYLDSEGDQVMASIQEDYAIAQATMEHQIIQFIVEIKKEIPIYNKKLKNEQLQDEFGKKLREYINEIQVEKIEAENKQTMEEFNQDYKKFEYQAIPSAEITVNVDINNEPIEQQIMEPMSFQQKEAPTNYIDKIDQKQVLSQKFIEQENISQNFNKKVESFDDLLGLGEQSLKTQEQKISNLIEQIDQKINDCNNVIDQNYSCKITEDKIESKDKKQKKQKKGWIGKLTQSDFQKLVLKLMKDNIKEDCFIQKAEPEIIVKSLKNLNQCMMCKVKISMPFYIDPQTQQSMCLTCQDKSEKNILIKIKNQKALKDIVWMHLVKVFKNDIKEDNLQIDEDTHWNLIKQTAILNIKEALKDEKKTIKQLEKEQKQRKRQQEKQEKRMLKQKKAKQKTTK